LTAVAAAFSRGGDRPTTVDPAGRRLHCRPCGLQADGSGGRSPAAAAPERRPHRRDDFATAIARAEFAEGAERRWRSVGARRATWLPGPRRGVVGALARCISCASADDRDRRRGRPGRRLAVGGGRSNDRHMLGTFPQAFSHVGLINSALNLCRRQGPAEERTTPPLMHSPPENRGSSQPEQGPVLCRRASLTCRKACRKNRVRPAAGRPCAPVQQCAGGLLASVARPTAATQRASSSLLLPTAAA
jgi:hypothetical protein